MDWEYVSTEDAFAGQIWMGVGKNDGACFTESDFAAGEVIDFAACKRNAKPGFVCDLDRQKNIAADFVCGLYAEGYTLVICEDRDGEIKKRQKKAKDGDPKRDGRPDGDNVIRATLRGS